MAVAPQPRQLRTNKTPPTGWHFCEHCVVGGCALSWHAGGPVCHGPASRLWPLCGLSEPDGPAHPSAHECPRARRVLSLSLQAGEKGPGHQVLCTQKSDQASLGGLPRYPTKVKWQSPHGSLQVICSLWGWSLSCAPATQRSAPCEDHLLLENGPGSVTR